MRRLFVPAVLVASIASSASLACAATPDPPVIVPDRAVLSISGHGWGHGHGMSQYGAKGAAEQGRTAAEIVDFYYPGTTLGDLTGHVKVLITADDDNNTVVVPRSGLNVRDLKTKEKWKLPDNGATRWRLAASAGGVSVVSYRTDVWHSYLTLTGDGEFTAWGQPITLVTPSGSVQYRGALRSVRPTATTTARDTVNVLRIDSYLRGVVPREMPASWSPAAVQAQAIAARTYASYERANPLTATYQICDTTSCQVYGGYSAEDSRANAAIDATAGKVLLYDGEPAFAQFSSSNGGWSAVGSAPYLVAREDDYDAVSGNPYHDWTVTFDAAGVQRRFPRLGDLKRITISRDAAYDEGGRVSQLVLAGSKDDVTVSGDTFRSVMGLKSTWFTLTATAK
jgi:stage II sporulation protein D